MHLCPAELVLRVQIRYEVFSEMHCLRAAETATDSVHVLVVSRGSLEMQVYPTRNFGDSARPDKHPATRYLALYAFDAALWAARFAKYGHHWLVRSFIWW